MTGDATPASYERRWQAVRQRQGMVGRGHGVSERREEWAMWLTDDVTRSSMGDVDVPPARYHTTHGRHFVEIDGSHVPLRINHAQHHRIPTTYMDDSYRPVHISCRDPAIDVDHLHWYVRCALGDMVLSGTFVPVRVGVTVTPRPHRMWPHGEIMEECTYHHIIMCLSEGAGLPHWALGALIHVPIRE